MLLAPALALLLAAPPDPLLASLVDEALARNPTLARARALSDAERERVAPAGAWSDPFLTLGIQNDGFNGLQIGKMETSYWQVMVTQPVPWPGKTGLRGEVARLGVTQAEADLERSRLTLKADVERAYLDLLLVRERLALLTRREAIWVKAEGTSRIRYETGDGAQSDLLRSQLERTRLRQRRAALLAEERTRLQQLARLTGRPLDATFVTTATVAGRGLPTLPDPVAAWDDAEARSPELASARAGAERGARGAELARRERFPDVAVTAAIMPRGSLEPMWAAGLTFSIPIFPGSRQSRAVAEQEARAEAGVAGAEAIRQELRQRVEERHAVLAGLLETAALYQGGLLAQSRATAESTLSQYRAGRVSFASVLEALSGVIADEEGWLDTLAEAQRIEIAAAEVSLQPAGAIPAGGGSAAMPGAGAMSSSSASSSSAPAAASTAPPAASGGSSSGM